MGDAAHPTASLPVTVVIPAYNRPAATARAVQSALGQRPRPPAEVIVVDDGSSDDTADRAGAAGATVIRHEVNGGVSAARNTGIRAAAHPWVAYADRPWLTARLRTALYAAMAWEGLREAVKTGRHGRVPGAARRALGGYQQIASVRRLEGHYRSHRRASRTLAGARWDSSTS